MFGTMSTPNGQPVMSNGWAGIVQSLRLRWLQFGGWASVLTAHIALVRMADRAAWPLARRRCSVRGQRRGVLPVALRILVTPNPLYNGFISPPFPLHFQGILFLFSLLQLPLQPCVESSPATGASQCLAMAP